MKVVIKGMDQTMRSLKAAVVSEISKGVKATTTKVIENLKKSTPVDTGRARDGWKGHVKGNIAEVTNDVEYIDHLNNGSSSQAPRFFIEKAILETPNVSPNGQIVVYK